MSDWRAIATLPHYRDRDGVLATSVDLVFGLRGGDA